MIEWKRLYAKPAGSLPGGVVTQWGVGAITVFILLFLTYWILLEGGEPAEVAGLTEVATTAPRSFTQQMTAQVDAETMRAETNKAAEARAAAQALRDERAEQQRQAQQAGLTAANQAAILAGPSPDSGQPYTQEEWELRERLRLEAVERRSRSLRSSPVAQSYRKLDGGASGGKQIVDNPAPAKDEGAEALQHALDTMHTVTSGLEDEIAAEAQADQAFIAALTGRPITPQAAPVATAPTAASATPQDYSLPARLEAPQDPPGWERIYEGSFLEAVLTTQLTGDLPGPVLAVVAIPFYSADRQRILVPRGTRIIGAAQAVTNQDQSRLGVGFHRLIYPDGSWVSLQFRGLNQLGEGALKDQVDRHYFSMFAAVGAVGVLSGLTAAGGNPYEGGTASMRSAAGQGLGQAATRILDRFLNRMPTITIRAGHRLRVWFTSDVLVLRPTTGEKMNRTFQRILTAGVVIPLFLVVSITPAHAILGSILAGIKRTMMIANQVTQIYNDTIAKLTFDGQLTQMIGQAAHLKEQALGTVGALTDPFTELASLPTKFIGLGLSWKNEFTGIPRGIASSVENMGESGKSFRESWAQRLTAADTVSESDILNLFQSSRPEIAAEASRGFLAAREDSDKRLVLSHTMSDTASNLMLAAKDAVESYEGLQNNTNVSNTALAQSQIAGTVTQGNLTAAMVQLMAFEAANEAAKDYEREIARREALAERVAAQQQSQLLYNAHIAGIEANRQSFRDGMNFPIPGH